MKSEIEAALDAMVPKDGQVVVEDKPLPLKVDRNCENILKKLRKPEQGKDGKARPESVSKVATRLILTFGPIAIKKLHEEAQKREQPQAKPGAQP